MATYTPDSHWPIPLGLSPQFKRSVHQFFLRVPSMAKIDTLLKSIITDVLDSQERDGVSDTIRISELQQYSQAICDQTVTAQQKESVEKTFEEALNEICPPF